MILGAAAAALVGLLIGSFLNVVVHRVPEGRSVADGRSVCPSCGSGILARDNIPVLSWVLLHGRCRSCAAPIPVRYPLIELSCAVLFVALVLRLGTDPVLPALLVLGAAGIALAVIDLDVGRLPFVITVPMFAVVAALLVIDGLADGWSPAATAAASMAVWLGIYGGLWLGTAGRGMGLGDVVLAPSLGLALGWLGWGPSLVGLIAGFAAGAIVGIVLIAAGRAGRRTAMPFGPFMLTGAAVGVFVGSAVWGSYLGLTG
jgi:leader peptidase (prepilin peptidase)/N-methyltransferase